MPIPILSTATNVKDLKAGFKDAILGIRPRHSEHQDKPWRYVKSNREVLGSDIRTFHLQTTVGKRTGTGVQSPEAGEYELELRIWTSYAGLSEDDDDGIRTADQVDLERTLRHLKNQLAGLYSASYLDWESEADEGGRLWGAHAFNIIYLQET